MCYRAASLQLLTSDDHRQTDKQTHDTVILTGELDRSASVAAVLQAEHFDASRVVDSDCERTSLDVLVIMHYTDHPVACTAASRLSTTTIIHCEAGLTYTGTTSWPFSFTNVFMAVTVIYLADELHHPAESEFRRRLRSASSHELSVPRTQLSTFGDRAFPVAAVRTWNSLPQHIT